MNPQNEKTILDALLDFDFKQIPTSTRFWMIRTKKGYFYNEFLSKSFVALAWNNITSSSNFNDIDSLADDILLNYPEIQRPRLVINKCKSFINEVKKGDIIVIPSKGSSLVAFAIAGDYYEDQNKTLDIEKTVINRIEQKEVVINDVSCPYKKRRHIQIIKIVRSENINYHLYRALSSYHGINNLDPYATLILDQLYNYYTFGSETHIVFNVTKEKNIGLLELSKFLYGVTDSLASIIPQETISTKLALESPGDIVINIFNFICDNYLPIIAMIVFLGGGSFLTIKLPGVPQIIKDILSIKSDQQMKKAELKGIELDNLNKKLDLYNRLIQAGIDPASFDKSLSLLNDCAKSMEIKVTEALPPIPSPATEQNIDEDDEQL